MEDIQVRLNKVLEEKRRTLSMVTVPRHSTPKDPVVLRREKRQRQRAMEEY